MIVIIDLEGNGASIKNGGYARFDLAEALNDGKQSCEKHLTLVKNPDPEAYIEFSLVYEPLQEVETGEMSMLNMSDINMNVMDSAENQEDGGEEKSGNLGSLITKFQKLAFKIKQNGLRHNQNQRISPLKISELERQIEQLKASQQQLQIKYQQSQFLNHDLRKKIQAFEERRQQQLQTQQTQHSNYPTNKQKTQSAQILALQSTISEYQKQLANNESNQNSEESSRIKQLQLEKVKLQKSLADKSNQIGQLFNAAIEIGGAELLDRLQNAIGLIQNK